MYVLKNSKPTLNEPVPDKVWIVTILPSLTAGFSAPNNNFLEASLKPARPSIGKYS